jgi:E3 ubiquitin-protein ligase MARCH6
MSIREPLSTVPYDLVFLHLVLPYTIHYFRPRKATNEIGIFLWQKLSPKFRLSSYMFGGRFPEEETLSQPSKFPASIFGTKAKGTWRRVPATDNVAMVRNMRATAEVDANGVPINLLEQTVVTAQNAEAVRNKLNPEEDYTVVYIPPHFRYRIALFILCVWSMCCLGIATLATMPVLLGRQFFSIFTSREIHDGYSFIVGFHLLWACWVVGRTVDRLDRRRRRKESDRASWPLFITKRTLLWTAKASYMAFFLVVVIPSLIATVVELYIIFPVRSIFNPDIAIRIRLTDMWVLGLFYTKIVLRLPGFEAPNHMNDGIQRVCVLFLSVLQY